MRVASIVNEFNKSYKTAERKTEKLHEIFELDTCLRKAHFIAQIGHEMGFKSSGMKEGHNFKFSKVSSKYFSTSQTIDNIMLLSLKDYLSDTFKIVDPNDKEINKINDELFNIIKDNNLTVDVRKLYARYRVKEITLKEVKVKTKDKIGKEIDELKFKIILKKYKDFRIPYFSRVYATYPNGKRGLGNGNELSREGFMFCGKGVKQLTGKGNYISFFNFRKNNPFPDDPKGYIDFTKVTDKTNYKRNFDLLADTNNVIYGVQSALWFYQKGGVSIQKKYAADWAEEDDIKRVTRIINGGYNGLEDRKNKTLLARDDSAFKVYKHYEEIYSKSKQDAKTIIEKKIKNISSDYTYKGVNLKDEKAGKLLEKLKEIKPISSLKPKGIKLNVLKAKNDIILKPIKNE